MKPGISSTLPPPWQKLPASLSPEPIGQKPDGSSLLPVLQGKKRAESPFFLSGWTENFRMYREQGWKIVKVNGEEWELYNLKQDPAETINLAGRNSEKLQQHVKNYQANSPFKTQ